MTVIGIFQRFPLRADIYLFDDPTDFLAVYETLQFGNSNTEWEFLLGAGSSKIVPIISLLSRLRARSQPGRWYDCWEIVSCRTS